MQNLVYLFHNGQRMAETEHLTRSVIDGVIGGIDGIDGDWGEAGGAFGVVSTGGREILMRAEQGDTLHLEAHNRCWGGACFEIDLFYNIFVCFEYNAM